MQGDKMIPIDLFEFAYVPDWYGQLNELAAMALPEPWRFKKPTVVMRNTDTPILERYINMIFRKQSIDYNTESNPNMAAKFFMWRTSMPVFTRDCTIIDIKRFMVALNAIKSWIPHSGGIFTAFAMKYHQD